MRQDGYYGQEGATKSFIEVAVRVGWKKEFLKQGSWNNRCI